MTAIAIVTAPRAQKIIDGFDARFRLRPDGTPDAAPLRVYGMRAMASRPCAGCGPGNATTVSRLRGCGCRRTSSTLAYFVR